MIGLGADNDLDGARAFALVETVSDSCEGKNNSTNMFHSATYYLVGHPIQGRSKTFKDEDAKKEQ